MFGIVEKERKKAEKEARFAAKKAKADEGKKNAPPKAGKKGRKVETAAGPYVEETPAGQKKSGFYCSLVIIVVFRKGIEGLI